jgi:hypothetical protein
MIYTINRIENTKNFKKLSSDIRLNILALENLEKRGKFRFNSNIK